jgi:hypothetical protein
MILTGENQSTGRRTCHSATLSTTNLKRTDPGSNAGPSVESPATDRLSHGTAPGTELTDMTFADSVRTSQRTPVCFH